MFGRRKKQDPPKKKGAIEKIVMGAIIGTAIGSVIGLTVAPKKGKESRNFLKKKFEKRNEFIDEDVKEIGKLTKETAEGLFSIAKKILKRKEASNPLRNKKGLKKIPNEMEPSEWAIPEDQEK
jgi:gas vesicle protein